MHSVAILNPEQTQAVEHVEGPLLIFAGAGSGKTRVLTHRIFHLIHNVGLNPEQILAVTFTNKAAGEMQERVAGLFSQRLRVPWIATFHSACARILRAHAEALGYTKQFVIYDSSEALAALKRVYKKLKIDPKTIDPKTVMRMIDKAKNDYRSPDCMRAEAASSLAWFTQVADLYEAYQEELQASNAMDFGDLLCNVVHLFTLEKNILSHYQSQFQHILIDEYQDTNKVQYLLVHKLAEKTENLCVVGDDDQSIYAFRGASVENILNFKKDFPTATTITLSENYRSTKTIIEAANSVIAQNTHRQKKSMRTQNRKGDLLGYYEGEDEKDEARFVVDEVISLVAKGVALSDIAMLYRINAQSRALEEALCSAGLPYKIFGGHRFYDRKEIRDILAYFKLILNPSDNEAFLRIVNTPTRGLGKTSINALNEYALNNRISLFVALQNAAHDAALNKEPPWFKGATAKKFSSFLALIETLKTNGEGAQSRIEAAHEAMITNSSDQDIARELPLFLQKIAEESGYLKRLRSQDTAEAESRIENINELFNVAHEFSASLIEQGAAPTFENFLDRASLSSDLDDSNTKAVTQREELNHYKGEISLMTLHLAKGLEFDTVFLLGLEEGLLPHSRSLDDSSATEEERRLCYVGITRAREQLYLSRALYRNSFSNSRFYSRPSRFLRDIPGDLILDLDGFVH